MDERRANMLHKRIHRLAKLLIDARDELALLESADRAEREATIYWDFLHAKSRSPKRLTLKAYCETNGLNYATTNRAILKHKESRRQQRREQESAWLESQGLGHLARYEWNRWYSPRDAGSVDVFDAGQKWQ